MSCYPELLFTVMPWPTVNGWGLAGAGALPWQLQARYLTLRTLRGRGRCHHQPLSGKGSVLGWPGFSWGWKLREPQQLLGILLGPACPGTRLKTFAGREPADPEPGTAGGDVRDHL